MGLPGREHPGSLQAPAGMVPDRAWTSPPGSGLTGISSHRQHLFRGEKPLEIA